MPNINLLSGAFYKMGRYYSQGILRAKANTHFQDKYSPSDDTYNPNGDEIVISKQLSVKPLLMDTVRSDYGSGFDLPSFEDVLFKLPNHNQTVSITAKELEKRRLGQNPLQPVDKSTQYMLALMAKSSLSLTRLTRTIEKMSIDALVNGKLVFENNKELDFGMYGSHKITPATLWNIAGSDPITDLTGAIDVLEFDGGDTGYDVYMGQNAFSAFMYNTKVQDYIQRFNKGFTSSIIQAKEQNEDGIISYDPITLPNGYDLKIKVYKEYYDTFTDKGIRDGSVRMFPEDKVLIMGENTPIVKGLGKPEILPEGIISDKGISQIISINNGAVIQFVEINGKKSVDITTLSCQAPIVQSMDMVAVLSVA